MEALKIVTNRTRRPSGLCGGLAGAEPHLSRAGLHLDRVQLTENPLSEVARINGGAAGGNGTCRPRRIGVRRHEPSQFGDPTAVGTGAWSADQSGQATVRVITAPTVCCQKRVPCNDDFLRLTRITGYEVYCSIVSVIPTAIAAGPNGAGQYGKQPAAHLPKNGDVLKRIDGYKPGDHHDVHQRGAKGAGSGYGELHLQRRKEIWAVDFGESRHRLL